MSRFPDMVTQYGGSPIGVPYMPAIRNGAKAFFVDPASGNDNNSGRSPKDALDTVAAAYAKTTDKAGDIVFLLGDGSTTGTARDTAIVWSNSNTHLIGVTAPGLNKRARISTVSASTDVDAYTPYITVSGSGNIFANFSLFQGNSEDSKSSIGIELTGNQNYFSNVDVITGAHANQGDEASVSVRVRGDENVFSHCYIGGDTWARGGAVSANIKFGDGSSADEAQRNIFEDCTFTMWADGTDPLFVSVTGLTDIQRWNLFRRCNFINTGTSTLTAGVSVVGSATGRLFFDNCGFFGVTDVTADDSTYVYMLGPTPGTPVECGLYKGVDIA